MIYLVLAVVVDSAVTLYVGYFLNKTAKREVKAAVDEIGPAIKRELETTAQLYMQESKKEIALAIQKLIPVILKGIKANAQRSGSIRSTNVSRDTGT